MNALDSLEKICAQDGSEPDSSGRKITFEMTTQTSTIELPIKEENNETDDDKKMKLEGGSNGDVVREEKKDMMEMSELK